jgi:hypothetical protein
VKALLFLLAMSSVASADKPSKSAEAWLAGMTTGTTPVLKKPLAFSVQSDQCPKLTRGKASSAAELAVLKTCFAATWSHVAKEATLVVDDIKLKDLDGDQLRFHKTAPKGTTWVRASRSYAGQDLTVRLALGADRTVLAVWFVYAEHDGE